MGLSRLAEKCMEALAYCEMPNLAASMTEPILRETMTVMVDGSPTVVYKDEIEKQLYKGLYPHLGIQYGG